jgi:hypothetical protein
MRISHELMISLLVQEKYRNLQPVPSPLAVSIIWVEKHFPLLISWLSTVAKHKFDGDSSLLTPVALIQEKV